MDAPLIRIACVGYTNAWPLTRHLDPTIFEVCPCVPSEAARLLRTGEADVGLIPVGALLTDSEYRVVPGLAIGCDGDVASVLLVGETPLSEWEAVALDGESRTSVLLAQILLRGPLARPDLRIYPADAGTGAFHAQGRTGAVVIGDAARNLPERLVTRIDLGRVWKDWTGLPFVFAVWAGRTDLPQRAIDGLMRAAERGLADREAAPPEDRHYLMENIRYNLDDRALMGLRRFGALGKAAGLLPREDICLYGPTTRMRPRVSVDALLTKGAEGGQLTAEEGARLETEATLPDLGSAAHMRRMALHPAREIGWHVSRTLSPLLDRAELASKLAELVAAGGHEVVLAAPGGAAPTLGLELLEDLFAAVKSAGDLTLHALTPSEVLQVQRMSGLPLETVLDRLVAAGLDRLPLTGPWTDATLLVARAAHARGLRSVATLRFGGGESALDRATWLVGLRDLQAETGRVDAVVAEPAVLDDTLGHLGQGGHVGPLGNTTAAAWLRVTAVARLMVGDVDSVLASWGTQGPAVAQASFYLGCDAVAGVMPGESAVIDDLEHHIRVAGFRSVRRDAPTPPLPVAPDAAAVRG